MILLDRRKTPSIIDTLELCGLDRSTAAYGPARRYTRYAVLYVSASLRRALDSARAYPKGSTWIQRYGAPATKARRDVYRPGKYE